MLNALHHEGGRCQHGVSLSLTPSLTPVDMPDLASCATAYMIHLSSYIIIFPFSVQFPFL